MTAHDFLPILRRLETVLVAKTGTETSAQAARLIKRLKGPVHIALVGRAGSGKSELAKMLLQQVDFCDFEVSETTLIQDLVRLRAAVVTADIVLWCCQKFDDVELSLWSQMSDVIKDHSFLILTKADLLAAQGQLNEAMQALDDRAAEEFHSLFAIATPQALASSCPAQSAAFRSSGAAALKSTLLRQIALDREATRDSAFRFLDRHENAEAIPARNPGSTSPLSISVRADPLAYLQTRAVELRDAQSLPLTEKIQTILEHCCETASGLAELMGQSVQVGAEDLARGHEILAVADTMVLLRLECSASAATDALGLLFQLRRDLARTSIS